MLSATSIVSIFWVGSWANAPESYAYEWRLEGVQIPGQSSETLKLTSEERARLDKVSQPPLLYPYWHQVWTAKDRLSAADLAFLAPYLAG